MAESIKDSEPDLEDYALCVSVKVHICESHRRAATANHLALG